jgi:hypothetical protein
MTTTLVHGWRAIDPSQHYYTVIEVADYDGDEVWQSAAKLAPQMWWEQAHKIDAAIPDELKGKVLTRAEFDQAAHTRLELFRALRELSNTEAECARVEIDMGYDHEDAIAWYKTVEKIFFSAAVHDGFIGYIADNRGVYSHVESLLEVARLAIARAHKAVEEWDGDDDLLDPEDRLLLLQACPKG